MLIPAEFEVLVAMVTPIVGDTSPRAEITRVTLVATAMIERGCSEYEAQQLVRQAEGLVAEDLHLA